MSPMTKNYDPHLVFELVIHHIADHEKHLWANIEWIGLRMILMRPGGRDFLWNIKTKKYVVGKRRDHNPMFMHQPLKDWKLFLYYNRNNKIKGIKGVYRMWNNLPEKDVCLCFYDDRTKMINSHEHT